ncbi:MAG: hypothetical protein HXL39_00285 [Schaalia sp.]|nr:hypothetical protein [Schaalia sp.]
MISIDTLEKRTVSALSYFGLYKLHLVNLYLAYAQTQPWTLNKRELHDVVRSIIPTLSWKLDGTAIATAAHYRLVYALIKDDPFIANDDKQVIYDAWQALRWRTHLIDLQVNQENLNADSRLERRKTNAPNCRWVLEARTFGQGMPVFHTWWEHPDVQEFFHNTIGTTTPMIEALDALPTGFDMWVALDGQFSTGQHTPLTDASLDWMRTHDGQPWQQWAWEHFATDDAPLPARLDENEWRSRGGWWTIDPTLGRQMVAFPDEYSTLEPADLFARPPFIDLGLAGPLTYGDSLPLHLNGDTISIDDPDLAGLPSPVPLPPLGQIIVEHASKSGITHAAPGHIVAYTMEPNAAIEEYSNDLY